MVQWLASGTSTMAIRGRFPSERLLDFGDNRGRQSANHSLPDMHLRVPGMRVTTCHDSRLVQDGSRLVKDIREATGKIVKSCETYNVYKTINPIPLPFLLLTLFVYINSSFKCNTEQDLLLLYCIFLALGVLISTPLTCGHFCFLIILTNPQLELWLRPKDNSINLDTYI